MNIATLRGGASTRVLVIALSTPLAVAAPLSCAYAGGALPASGAYVSGSGTIAKAGKSGLTIDQSSATGIIDWNSFSIGRKNSVTFDNGSGATLNRVTGGNLSTIAGSLKATGSLYLINPQGMIVSGTGRVLTGGNFIGSSRDLSDDDFAHGKRRFTGTSKGAVVNQGTIRSSNGDVALIGSSASNSGILSASHGSASLDAGDNILLAPAGSGGHILVSGGSGDVTNSGTIAAAQAQLDAAGGNVYALSGNNGGIVRATGTSTIGGHVWLTSNSGNVSISGTIAATNANGSGGVVTARADNIVISGNINMSATKATMTGGTVSIVARNTTDVSGRIAAQGGDHGKGGFVETSGQHVHVEGSARITTLAKDGIAGDWLIDPNDFTIAASGGDITGAALSGQLASGSVTIKSSQGATSGNGDIFVDDAVSWTSDNTLTLDAYRNILVNAPVAVSGTVTSTGKNHLTYTSGRLDLIDGDQYQNGSPGSGNLIFGPNGYIDFPFLLSPQKTSLAINGHAYTLVDDISELATDVANNASGYYALEDNYDAYSDGTYSASPIVTAFRGTFEGLGNTISYLTIDDTADNTNVGLFASISAGGILRDIGLINANITSSGKDSIVGALAGGNSGTITQSYSNGTVTGSGEANDTGGLVGYSVGAITGSHSGGAITGLYVGGLVGVSNSTGSTVSNSYSTATVTGVEDPEGDISSAGGLVGYNVGSITDSYAAGSVAGASQSAAGGLAGFSDGTITQSYATGAVTGGDGGIIGGLVGTNDGDDGLGTITQSYATGDVAGGAASSAGGLVGLNYGTITQSYSTGPITDGSGGYEGGLVGKNSGDPSDGTGDIANSYWDTQTSGIAIGLGSDDNNQFVNGLTTAQLQSALPSGFSTSAWSIVPGQSFPYLTWQAPSGTPEVVSGVIKGASNNSGIDVGVLLNGVEATPLVSMSSGVNDYYYELLAPGSITSSGSDVMAYLASGSGHSNRVYQNATGSLTGFNLEDGALIVRSSAASETALLSVLKTALGNNSGGPFLYNNAGTANSGVDFDLDLTGSAFDLNSAISIGTGALDLVSAGAISESGSGTITAATLEGSSVSGEILNGANHIGSLSTFTNTGAGGFALTDDQSLDVIGAVHAGTGTLVLKTVGGGHNLSIANALTTTGTASLISAGKLAESGSGKLTAATLTGSAVGGTTLVDGNLITQLGNFANTGTGNFSFKNGKALVVSGAVSNAATNGVLALTTTAGNLTVDGSLTGATDTLVAAAEVLEGSAGSVTAKTILNTTAVTGINLDSTHNHIKKIGTRKTTSGTNVIDGVGQ